MEQTAQNLSPNDPRPPSLDVPEIAGRIGPVTDKTTKQNSAAGADPVAKGQNIGPSDADLVGKVLSGDRKSFDLLITRYQRQAIAVSYRLLGNSHDALEVTQDAFLKAFNSLATLQKAEAFGGWLMRIVSNLSLNYRRGRKTRSKAQLPLDDILTTEGESAGSGEWSAAAPDALRTLTGREMGEKLQLAMDALPEKQRTAIILFTIEQMPQKDIAEALHCSVEAVKWHVFQGRKKLKEALKEYL